MEEKQSTTSPPSLHQLDQLAHELELAKQEENQAREQRMAIEQKLCDLVGTKDEGSFSVKGDYYKITTVAGFSRVVDAEKWASIRQKLPADIAKLVIRSKLEVDTRQLKSLQQLNPAHYQLVAQAITTKPKKVSVKFERLEVQ